MASWEFGDAYGVPPDIQPRMQYHRRTLWNHVANPYTDYNKSYLHEVPPSTIYNGYAPEQQSADKYYTNSPFTRSTRDAYVQTHRLKPRKRVGISNSDDQMFRRNTKSPVTTGFNAEEVQERWYKEYHGPNPLHRNTQDVYCGSKSYSPARERDVQKFNPHRSNAQNVYYDREVYPDSTPYSNYDRRAYTWAGVINPKLYSKTLDRLTIENERDLKRMALTMSLTNSPCHKYGIEHWHPDERPESAAPAESESKVEYPEHSRPAWQNKDIIFTNSAGLDKPTVLDIETQKYEDTDTGPYHMFCYLCSTKEEHKGHQLQMQKKNKKKTNQKPRIMYIPPPPMVKKKKETGEKEIKYDISYKVIVTTANTINAGTDANVFITVKGTDGLLKKTQLRKNRSHFNFGRNTSEVFYIKGPDMGDLQYLIVEHDGVEKKQGWFLERIQMTNMKTRQTWEFQCQNWLSLFEKDQKVKRKLTAEEKEAEIKDYIVLVYTGSKRGAGTDSNVFITLFGRQGVSAKFKLQDKSKNCFERRETDKFDLSLEDIGPLTKIRIEHDGTGIAAGWFLEKVVIVDTEDKSNKYLFPCHDWLARDEGDGELWRDIAARGATKADIEQSKRNEKSGTVPFEFNIYTGDKMMAGTNANVFLQMFGKKGKTKLLPLTAEKGNHADPFERNQVDKFQFDVRDVGLIQKIMIGHDNAGLGAGWFLDKVIVKRFLPSNEIKTRVLELKDKHSEDNESKEEKKERKKKQGRKDSDKEECSDSDEGKKKSKKKKKGFFSKILGSDSDSEDSESDNDKKKQKLKKKSKPNSDSDDAEDKKKIVHKQKTSSRKDKNKKSNVVSTKEIMKNRKKSSDSSDLSSDSEDEKSKTRKTRKLKKDVDEKKQKRKGSKFEEEFNPFGTSRSKSGASLLGNDDEEEKKVTHKKGKAIERKHSKSLERKGSKSSLKKRNSLFGSQKSVQFIDSDNSDTEKGTTLKKKEIEKWRQDASKYQKQPKMKSRKHKKDSGESSDEDEAKEKSQDSDDSVDDTDLDIDSENEVKTNRGHRHLPRKIPYCDEYEFICQQWFAADEGDGQIQRILIPSRKKTLFKHT